MYIRHTSMGYLIFVRFELLIACSWAEKTLNTMNLQQKIGQLFVVAAVSSFPSPTSVYCMEKKHIEQMITDYYIGGLLFLYKSTPIKQIELFNEYNKLSIIPLCVLQDCEWGLQMRLDDTIKFPSQMTLGAIQNNDLLIALGKEIGRQCKVVGVDMNLAPVVDINTNSANPVIGNRSFGSAPQLVAAKAYALMCGMKKSGLAMCAKHFPGHGDTWIDSHHDIPVINHDAERLESVELVPFRTMISEGVDAIMSGHLLVSAYDVNQVASLSKNIVTDLLKKNMHFNGLVITDGLGMSAVHSDQKEPGEVELQAFQAGNDILLAPVDVPEAAQKIEQAVMQGTISIDDLNTRVLNILQLKEKLGLYNRTAINVCDVYGKLHIPEAYALKKQLYSEAVTLAVGDWLRLPLDQESVPCIVQIGGQVDNCFARTIQNNVLTMHISCFKNISAHDRAIMVKKIKAVDTILFTVFDFQSNSADQFGISSQTMVLFEELRNIGKKIIVILFGTPYVIPFFKKADVVLVAYEDDNDAQLAAAEIVLGKRVALGKLPVLIN